MCGEKHALICEVIKHENLKQKNFGGKENARSGNFWNAVHKLSGQIN